MFDSLHIQSPKRTVQSQHGWSGFFPYYAGYSESFAHTLLESANLPKGAMVLDPWNGSGTTTFSASRLGLDSKGFDLNPAMITVARARLLPPSEADSIEPLARETVRGVRADRRGLSADDPLLSWFEEQSAALIRSLERRIREQLVGGRTLMPTGTCMEQLSGLAATFYVALFAVCRRLAAPFRSSNPTWLRKPARDEPRVTVDRKVLLGMFTDSLRNMAAALAERRHQSQQEHAAAELKLADTTTTDLDGGSVDLILSSPPYCTRIDYSVATRIELAVLHPLTEVRTEDLGRRMMGSTRVPDHDISIQESWGATCTRFLTALRAHPSKASGGYYYKTHLDYFEKMARSLANVSEALKPNGAAILIVQDSYYKNIHNDLPGITTEMAEATGLKLRRRADFHLKRTMAGINPYTRTYKRAAGAVEAVLCFEKT